jgi:hypothetical protein
LAQVEEADHRVKARGKAAKAGKSTASAPHPVRITPKTAAAKTAKPRARRK